MVHTDRYRHAEAPNGFLFKFNLCTDHRFSWDETLLGKILEVKEYRPVG